MTDENPVDGDESDSTSTEPDHVVTAFLRNRGEILACRRSDDVGTYPGAWGGVSGFAEGDPDEQVRVEIREETGLPDDAVSLVRSGRPLSVSDPDIGREWVVHPFLFDVDTREIELSDEHTDAAWIPPTDLAVGDRETVPKLWETYERVAPTVRSITADDEHGAAWLSIRALDVLRDRAGLLVRERGDESASGSTAEQVGDANADDEWDELAALATRLLEARPSMAVLRNRVNRAMNDALTAHDDSSADTDGDPAGSGTATEPTTGAGAVLESTIDGIDRAVDADAAATRAGAEFVTGRVLTLSRSGTVRDALRAGELDRVFVAESRPGSETDRREVSENSSGETAGSETDRREGSEDAGGEGVGVAEELAAFVPVTLCADAAVAHVLATESIDAVVVGADTVLPDGGVVNKVGTRAAAIAAAAENVPVYAITASAKVSTRDGVNLESGDRRALYVGDAAIDVTNPTFDVTPAEYVTGLVTERGILDPDEIEPIADDFRAYEAWR
ncbi:NUDIX domain-containing protein [Halovivax cerinus]|uniref:NUDIX domain-containing protein n=1 Tax=Halovivax cerinus TaxID=1487865 RepID=A0ABD5NTD2_9EURY|nr:NUDIX domain-containing protein [Halovivax cerinus]